jgi:hypothetical protein
VSIASTGSLPTTGSKSAASEVRQSAGVEHSHSASWLVDVLVCRVAKGDFIRSSGSTCDMGIGARPDQPACRVRLIAGLGKGNIVEVPQAHAAGFAINHVAEKPASLPTTAHLEIEIAAVAVEIGRGEGGELPSGQCHFFTIGDRGKSEHTSQYTMALALPPVIKRWQPMLATSMTVIESVKISVPYGSASRTASRSA